MPENVNCAVCGGSSGKLRYTVEGFNLVECRSCGLLYVNPRLTKEELAGIYSSSDYYRSKDPMTCGYTDYISDRANITLTFERRLRTMEKMQQKGRILDFGCASGFFLDAARARGWEARGVEISGFASAYAREKLGLDVHTGRLAELKLPDGHFDAVTMWDVIEHMTDLGADFAEITRVLKPGGLLAVQTPNAGSLIARLTGANWACLRRPSEHIFFFSPRTIKAFLESAGYEDVRVTGADAGKVCDVDFVLNRLRAYGDTFFSAAARLAKWSGLGRKSVYVSIGDNMIAYARKKRAA
ncbi:MAG: class I SAM-dependent methyltransferase [Elusimicrobia bacterium]|nr:class I SAM-dependent methyltransferase [Elusimicrobiota bacterium]